jgi:hypothetical protein
LIFSFFQAIDEVLGTDYYHEYTSNGRATVDSLLPAMANVAGMHFLGVLVIDEAQNLSEANSGGERKLINYLVQLENIVGVPIILVGTSKLLPILGKNEFRQARRMSGEGELTWDRMQQDHEWEIFVQAMFRYQYTKDLCPVTTEISSLLYDLSQGIIDVAVKLFKLAQIRAIETGKKQITPGILRSVAHDSLKLLEPALEALRHNNSELISRFDDIYPMWKQDRRSINSCNRQANTLVTEKNKSESSVLPMEPLATKSVPAESQPVKETTEQKKAKQKSKTYASNSMMAIIAEGANQKVSAYDVLHRHHLIKVAP